MRAVTLCLLGVLAAGCRDSPMEVVLSASAAAAQGDLVAVQERFSVFTVQRLERHWRQTNVQAAQGWTTLASRLTLDGAAVEPQQEEIRGDYARVEAKAGTARRDYFLRKVDGVWRIELGAGPRFRRLAQAADESAAGAGEKPDG